MLGKIWVNIDQNECIIQVKFGLIQLVPVEPELFLSSTIIGHVTQYCNHMVSNPDKNSNIKKVYTYHYYTAYNTLVRPQVEYASPVWSPYTQSSINKVEKIQKRAGICRWVINDYSSYSSVT